MTKLRVLPESMHRLRSLRTLRILYCSNLTALPEWLGESTSLTVLEISGRLALSSLPQSLHRLGASGKVSLPINDQQFPHHPGKFSVFFFPFSLSIFLLFCLKELFFYLFLTYRRFYKIIYICVYSWKTENINYCDAILKRFFFIDIVSVALTTNMQFQSNSDGY